MDKIYRRCLLADISLELFDHLVLPVLLCGCEVWDLVILRKLEFCTENMSKYYWALQILLLMSRFMG